MNVALAVVNLHLSDARSLKEKRMVLNRLKGRLRSRFNVSVAEVEYQETWQRSAIALVAVGNNRDMVEQTLRLAEEQIERDLPGEVTGTEIDFLS